MASNTRLSYGASDHVRAEANQAQALKAAAAVVLEADMAETAGLMATLLAQGQIAFPDLPEEAEPDESDEALADALASEFDWDDEDEVPAEDAPPRPRHVYVLRVSCATKGVVRCDPPYSDWLGAQGKTPLGKTCLQNHANRIRTYRILAAYLQAEHAQALVKGPSVLRLGLKQADFANAHLQAIGVDASQLSRFLRNCDLVWDTDLIPGGASLPVRELFQER